MIGDILLFYYIICNICLFILFDLDKYKAKRHKNRISEKTLLLLGAMGGPVGGLLGMATFHHKTKKPHFWLIFILCLVGHLYLWLRFLV